MSTGGQLPIGFHWGPFYHGVTTYESQREVEFVLETLSYANQWPFIPKILYHRYIQNRAKIIVDEINLKLCFVKFFALFL